jgi:hypothetical protein
MADGEDFNGKIIEEFRANGGKVGGWFEGRLADPDQRATIYARQKEIGSNFADYEKSAAPREIPVILLDLVA